MFKLPSYFYAMQVEANVTTEADARQWIREWMKVKRLPRGTELWQNNADWGTRIARANRSAEFNAQTDF